MLTIDSEIALAGAFTDGGGNSHQENFVSDNTTSRRNSIRPKISLSAVLREEDPACSDTIGLSSEYKTVGSQHEPEMDASVPISQDNSDKYTCDFCGYNVRHDAIRLPQCCHIFHANCLAIIFHKKRLPRCSLCGVLAETGSYLSIGLPVVARVYGKTKTQDKVDGIGRRNSVFGRAPPAIVRLLSRDASSEETLR